jgi:class 3 adenylate cyclase
MLGPDDREAQRIDRVNIVGYDRPWHDGGQGGEGRETCARRLCVLKADVHGFGSLMRAGADGPARKVLVDAVVRWASPTAICETGAGDAVLIADDDPVALAQTARHLMDEVYTVPGQPLLRIALHHGEVQTRQRDIAPGSDIVGGEAILCAARVEPVVTPGQIWVTAEFREQFLQRPSLWRTMPILPPGGGERFNVHKPATGEPDLWVRLYRLES